MIGSGLKLWGPTEPPWTNQKGWWLKHVEMQFMFCFPPDDIKILAMTFSTQTPGWKSSSSVIFQAKMAPKNGGAQLGTLGWRLWWTPLLSWFWSQDVDHNFKRRSVFPVSFRQKKIVSIFAAGFRGRIQSQRMQKETNISFSLFRLGTIKVSTETGNSEFRCSAHLVTCNVR